MDFALEGSPEFHEEFAALGYDAQALVLRKIGELPRRPFGHKCLLYPGKHLFTIKFTDRRSEKRLVYEVLKSKILLLRILDRKNNYRELGQKP